jgi:hypothetical protein
MIHGKLPFLFADIRNAGNISLAIRAIRLQSEAGSRTRCGPEV